MAQRSLPFHCGFTSEMTPSRPLKTANTHTWVTCATDPGPRQNKVPNKGNPRPYPWSLLETHSPMFRRQHSRELCGLMFAREETALTVVVAIAGSTFASSGVEHTFSITPPTPCDPPATPSIILSSSRSTRCRPNLVTTPHRSCARSRRSWAWRRLNVMARKKTRHTLKGASRPNRSRAGAS